MPYSTAGGYRRFAITSCFRLQSRCLTTDAAVASGKWGSLPHDVITDPSVTLHQWMLRNVQDDLHVLSDNVPLYRGKGMQAERRPGE